MAENPRFSLFYVQEIVENCDMLAERISSHDMTRESYSQSTLYQDMLTMPMIRICEAVKLFRTDFERLCPTYDWKSVGAMRDKMAHPYGGFDYEFVWDAATEDAPELRAICASLLSEG